MWWGSQTRLFQTWLFKYAEALSCILLHSLAHSKALLQPYVCALFRSFASFFVRHPLLKRIRESCSEKCYVLRTFVPTFEVPWTWDWEKESRGPKPKSLKKVSKKVSRSRGPKVRKKSRKRSEKSKKKSENGFSETFRTFFETFFGLLGPGPGRLFRDFFWDCLAFGPETPSPRSTELLFPTSVFHLDHIRDSGWPASVGGQNLYTNTVRRGPPHTPGRLFSVYGFPPLFPWKQAFCQVFGIHQTSFLPVEALEFSELKTPLVYTFFSPKVTARIERAARGIPRDSLWASGVLLSLIGQDFCRAWKAGPGSPTSAEALGSAEPFLNKTFYYVKP